MADAPLERAARLGCARHALLLGGLLALALGIAVARNWGAVTRALGDAAALREGAGDARGLEAPADLRAWVEAHPDRGALVVWDLAGDSAVLALGDVGAPRPAVALPLVEVVADLEAEGPPVPAPALQKLPGVERGASDSAAVPLADVARRALRGDRAAGDALLHRAGAGTGAVPLDGLFLAWAGGLDAFVRLRAPERRARAWALSRRLRGDAAFRDSVEARLRVRGLGLGLDDQRRAALASFPRLRADSLARSLAHLVRTSRPVLEAATDPATDALRARGGRRLGVIGGGFPGVQSAAGVVTREGGGRVAVLLLDGLPHAVFYHLARTGLDVGLVLEALGLDAE